MFLKSCVNRAFSNQYESTSRKICLRLYQNLPTPGLSLAPIFVKLFRSDLSQAWGLPTPESRSLHGINQELMYWQRLISSDLASSFSSCMPGQESSASPEPQNEISSLSLVSTSQLFPGRNHAGPAPFRLYRLNLFKTTGVAQSHVNYKS